VVAQDKEGEDASTTESAMPKPFQQMVFLVRDWQHFEEKRPDVTAPGCNLKRKTYLNLGTPMRLMRLVDTNVYKNEKAQVVTRSRLLRPRLLEDGC
jgi:hypothetical protein